MTSNTRTRKNILNVEVSSPTTSPNTSNAAEIAKLIDTKLSELNEGFKAVLKQHEERLMEKLSGLSAEISNMRGEIKSLADKYKKLSSRYDNLNVELEENKLVLSAIESQLVASDVVVTNVPNSVDVTSFMSKVSKALACSSEFRVSKIFRTKSNNANASSPIIVKLISPDERASLFRSLADFRKAKNRNLQLSDIGVESSKNISIYECLSKYNRELLNCAQLHRHNKLLHSAFTLRGYVYVRLQANGKAIKLRDMKSLNSVVGGTSSK